MLFVVSMASAGPAVKVTGVFAGPARASCIVTTSSAGTNGTGFNNAFQLIDPANVPWWTTSETSNTVVTFYSDGTVTRDSHSHSITQSQNPVSTSADFTSTSTSSGAIPGHSFTQSYSIAGEILTGPWDGVTFTIDNITQDGWVSLDGKTITSFSTTPYVETETFSNGVVYHRICTRASTVFKIQ